MSTVKREASFKMHHPAEALFPLFSAEGEKDWVPGWDYENVMGGATDLHEDYVFLTAGHNKPEHDEAHAHGHHSSGDQAKDKTIWLVKKHDPSNFFVQFYRVEPGDKVAIISVQCKAYHEDVTEVTVAYEYIGMSKKGNDFVDHYTAEAHDEFIHHWHMHLTHYFEEK